MSSFTNQPEKTPIERWVKAVKFVDDVDPAGGSYTLSEMHEIADKIELAKRSKPSYKWEVDEQNKWWRIWFQESNLTIQIDLYFSNGEYQMNMHEIDLGECKTSTNFVALLYGSTLHKQWSCPEMLWAIMEVADEVSLKKFGDFICNSYLNQRNLNWMKPNS
ncbi:MAG: hypothetical protein HC916_01305 [Coleofasciculaceae cyanobacterium SM2_1_6]|nr:hypothetical protein [Coleofasciculaceae cyanobacterium SM2_1_6]